ncbi:MAG: NAD(P)/FAD-dependent oxidoreductase [Betaproteobacteria bacterium]|nr:MAG: NAD(P)/FAD-dependent oxidoreductase [Betaproteobacteria bacterium]
MSDRAIVIGAGVDALVAAHLLKRAGRDVIFIEEKNTEDDGGWVPPQIARELGLELHIKTHDPWAVVPLPQGGTLELWHDMGRTVEALRRLSPRDAASWPQFCARTAAIARLFEQLYGAAPVNPLNVQLAFRVRRLGRQAMEDLMRLLPMSVAELLDDWFECDALKGALAAMGIVHLQQGPRSAGTAFRLLHHHVGSPQGVFRPARSNLGAALRARPGIDIRAGAARRIVVRDGRVSGVALASGEELAAPLVVSGTDPRRTLLELVEPGWLEPEFARALGHVRRRGVVARVSFKVAPCARVVIAPSLDYLERAYDASKYGRVSVEPYIEVISRENAVEAHFQYAPYRRADGAWDSDRRSELGELTRRLLSPHVGGIADARVDVQTPPDLELAAGWPEGQAYHAELALDQALWMRPLPELASYRTPIEGLWLCGPGTHPGGGVAGASGRNCAREILRSPARRAG